MRCTEKHIGPHEVKRKVNYEARVSPPKSIAGIGWPRACHGEVPVENYLSVAINAAAKRHNYFDHIVNMDVTRCI